MPARPAPQLPDPQHSDSYTYEPKLDGWRCLAFHRLDGAIALQSRQHKSLTAYFPDLTAALLAQVPPGTVLDGELVIYRDGRCDFGALHQRLTRPTHPPTTAS